MKYNYNRYYQGLEDGVPEEDLLSEFKKVTSYNEHVSHFLSMIFGIIYRDSKTPPPTEFQWVYVGKEKWVTWPLWTGKDFSINLKLDGDFIAVNSAGDLIKGLKIQLNPIKDISEMMNIKYKDSNCTFEDLYNSVSGKRDFFGIYFYPHWPDKATYNQM